MTTGAIKNAGDFLIHERGLELLESVLDRPKLTSVARWKPADPDLVASSTAVIACGGPGLRRGLVSDTYMPAGQALEAGRPVVFLGVGWGSTAGVSLDGHTAEAVRAVQRSTGLISVRDPITERRLAAATGCSSTMTGCPAWYDLERFGERLARSDDVSRILFTPPASPRFLTQAEAVIGALSDRFAAADRTIVLHRGRPSAPAVQDSYRAPRSVARSVAHQLLYRRFERSARRLGWNVIDISGATPSRDLYGSTDLHVGYRVHAHIQTLSLRRPSVLIAEDIRGIGQFAALDDSYWLIAGAASAADIVGAVDLEVRDAGSSELGVAKMKATWPVMRSFVARIGQAIG